jgi:hypothetical protein
MDRFEHFVWSILLTPKKKSDLLVGSFQTGLAKLSRYSQKKGAAYRAMADPLDFKFKDNRRPPCSKCGRPLILTRIEPEEPGFDLRTYYCAACEDNEVTIAACS